MPPRKRRQRSSILPLPSGSYRVTVYVGGLRAQIMCGELLPGAQLPTVAQLAVANTVAVGTAHRALTLRRAEGLIEVERGRRA
jgi:integrase